jgi:hypothetical protein
MLSAAMLLEHQLPTILLIIIITFIQAPTHYKLSSFCQGYGVLHRTNYFFSSTLMSSADRLNIHRFKALDCANVVQDESNGGECISLLNLTNRFYIKSWGELYALVAYGYMLTAEDHNYNSSIILFYAMVASTRI